MLSMKILSWNVRGLGGVEKCKQIKAYIRNCDPDVIIIQETKKVVCSRLLRSIASARLNDWSFILSVGASGGIRIAWDSLVLSKVDCFSGLYSPSIVLSFKDSAREWLLSGVYGSALASSRQAF